MAPIEDEPLGVNEALNAQGVKLREGVRREPGEPTASGPNLPNDNYAKGHGPMQLVACWTATGLAVLGWRGDSFAMFPSSKALVAHLRAVADQFERDDPYIRPEE